MLFRLAQSQLICLFTLKRFNFQGDECIPEAWLCDHTIDCHDKSDEDELVCSNLNKTCATGEFLCSTSGGCIPQYWLCDGMVDCNDKSDENADFCNDFLRQAQCPEGLFSCSEQGLASISLECLSPHVVCDGKTDCSNGKDEKNCPQPSCLVALEFACDMDKDQSARCLPVAKLCDGILDCFDGSDENTCPNKEPLEGHRAFLNSSGKYGQK